MMTVELDERQRAAVEAPFEECVAIVGCAGTGKTYALQHRIARARDSYPGLHPLIVTDRRHLDAFAFDVLRLDGAPLRRIDDVDASLTFARACEPLFALEWEEFAAELLDPEVPGLRTPERFAESAFRLIRKLRDARISPEDFLARSLAGATEFYAKPPNLANPLLLAATKDAYRDSLDVGSDELRRQHRREVDLAKILARLYERYVETLARERLATGRDAIVSAGDALRARPALARELRETHRLAFVDDAEELTAAELYLLTGVYGDALAGVTLCGDASSAIGTLAIAQPGAAFEAAAVRVELTHHYRCPQVVDAACRLLAKLPVAAPQINGTPLLLHRAKSEDEEARFVADSVARWLAGGVAADRIAVIFRSVASIERFEEALLARDVPAIAAGDRNVFADRRALDALALLWNLHDPFRHDWMLRTLANPALGLSDASIATLCSEPPHPQAPLFVLDDEPAPTARATRWDPKRDLRLGWNVVSGEQDAALGEIARERLTRFRLQRRRWLELAPELDFETLARTVWGDALAREGAPGSARARAQHVVLQRLLARFRAFTAENPGATFADVLAYAESRGRSELESCEADDAADGFVRLLSVEAARGREFDYVAIAGAAPGTFPRWYAPDAFLFSPRLGMVPKENVGEGRASRTAKFSYYVHRIGAREGYNARERRAFLYALRRARCGAVVTASGGATRGATAPEFLEELRASRLPGIGNV